jgi:hypothetical protein
MIEKVTMNKSATTLEQRIVAALGNPNSASDTLIELVREVEQAAAIADQTAADERAKAVDLTQSPDPKAAHERVVEAELRRDRLRGAMPKLRDKLADAIASEARERWSADYRRVRQKRDEAVTLFKTYSEHAEAIARVFALAEQVDREVSRINGSAPDGIHDRLRSVELEARNLERFARDQPEIAKTLQLPDFVGSNRMLWPRTSAGSLAAEFAQSMIAPDHPGPRWGDDDTRQERRREFEKETQRLGEFYQEQTAAQEERENAEERERFASRP